MFNLYFDFFRMRQPEHTPGPWRYDDFFYIWADSEGPKPVVELDKSDGKVARVRGGSETLSQNANARLIVAAVNAFDSAARRLGIPATELAEGLQRGEIADLLMTLDDLSDRVKRLKDALREGKR
jgi:hypothetical protein